MDAVAPVPVISGHRYRVLHPRGADALDGLVGDTHFAIELGEQPYVVCGAGRPADGGAVRFHEKTADGTGKDLRVWTITAAADGGLEAEHTPRH